MAKDPELRTVPAARGLAWVTGALLLLRRQPARLMLIGLVLQFIMGFSQVGAMALLLVLAIPSFTAGVMQAMFAVDQGARPPLAILFAAFLSSGRLLRLIVLGALMLAAGVVAVMVVLSGVLAGLDPAILARLEAGDVSALEAIDPAVMQRLMLAMLAGLLVSGTVSYFAIPLIWFLDLPLGRAILTGLAGMVRNWRPFLLLGLLMAVLALPVVIMTSVMFLAGAGGSVMSPVLTVLTLLLLVAFQLVLFGAQYCSYRDIFGTGARDETPGQDDGQLVA